MKNKNNFSGVFWIGLIPVSVIVLSCIMALFGIIYNIVTKPAPKFYREETIKDSHICPKQKIIYIHDTIKIKVTKSCNLEHISPDVKQVTGESLNGVNDSNNADQSNK